MFIASLILITIVVIFVSALEAKRKRFSVSCREYYCYKLQIRPLQKSILLHGGRLFQQYVVDMYVKV